MAEYTIRGASYTYNRRNNQLTVQKNGVNFKAKDVVALKRAGYSSQMNAKYLSGEFSSGAVFEIGWIYPLEAYLQMRDNGSGVLTNTNDGDVVFVVNESEWRRESETRYTEPTQTTRYDDSIYPSESYTEQGVRGRRIVSWEAEYVNGQPTGNRRNEQTQTLVDMKPTVRVVGTKRDRIEWRTQSQTESITATQTERRDPNVYPEDSYVQQGRDGQKRITYERKYVNGEQTEETRNRRESTIQDMQPYVRVIGTKQRARYLIPRIIFNGKHAIRVVRDNEVVRSIDGLTDLPARKNYVNVSSRSSSGGWARYELTEEISNGAYDLTIETPTKTTVSVEFKVLTFWGDNTTTTVQVATNETVEVNVSSGYYSAGVAVMSIEERSNNRITNVRLERR